MSIDFRGDIYTYLSDIRDTVDLLEDEITGIKGKRLKDYEERINDAANILFQIHMEIEGTATRTIGRAPTAKETQ